MDDAWTDRYWQDEDADEWYDDDLLTPEWDEQLDTDGIDPYEAAFLRGYEHEARRRMEA